MPIKRGHSALRQGRASLAGCIYLVTFATENRAARFKDHQLARCACRAITDPRLWGRSRLLAWVLMPDHWHGLIELGQGDTLSQLVGRLKANSARHARTAIDGASRIWAPAFHDRAMRAEESVTAAARYIIMNPVRAGLVRTPGQYPFWDAVWVDTSD